MQVLLLVLGLALGFVLLAKGAGWLVGGGAEIARRAGMSTLLVGLTIVAWGTSAPEVVVSGLAAVRGDGAISLGNVLGSNIANIGLVLGASSLILARVLDQRMQPREIGWLFASLGTLWWLMRDGHLGRLDGVALIALFAGHNVHLWWTSRDQPVVREDLPAGMRWPWLAVLAGTVAISLGAEFVVRAASTGGRMLGVDDRVIGLTVVAVGTSLPELAAGVSGALRGESEISLGNVVGSNVFNLLMVLGLVALVAPLDAATDPEVAAAMEQSLAGDLPVVLGFSLAAVALPWLGGARGGRLKGGLLLAAYAAYNVWLFVG